MKSDGDRDQSKDAPAPDAAPPIPEGDPLQVVLAELWTVERVAMKSENAASLQAARACLMDIARLHGLLRPEAAAPDPWRPSFTLPPELTEAEWIARYAEPAKAAMGQP